MGRKWVGRKWSDEEIDVLHRHYGISKLEKVTEIVNSIRAKNNLPPRTKRAIQLAAIKEKVDLCPDGMIPLADVFRMNDISHRAFYGYARKLSGEVDRGQVIGSSRQKFISIEQAKKIEEHFKKVPDHYIKASQASVVIGFYKEHLTNKIIKTNSIPWMKSGSIYFVPDWIIDCCNAYLKKTGGTRVVWRQAISDYAKSGFTFRHREAQAFLDERLKNG